MKERKKEMLVLFPPANDQRAPAPAFRHRSRKYHIRVVNRMESLPVGSEEKVGFEGDEDDGGQITGLLR
jgi:hypothetical protein